ncbi:MAG: hypothetical protein U5K84_08655 [Alkalibacterium sp.]|nr:hypothetical protein [Alkalibacterium sp.]
MQNNRTVWRYKDQADEKLLETLVLETGKSETFIELCIARGLHTKDAIDQFITPDISWLDDPFSFLKCKKQWTVL